VTWHSNKWIVVEKKRTEGAWDSVFLERKNWFLSFTEGKSGVQFIHRTLAYIVVGSIVYLYFKSKKFTLSKVQTNGINLLLVLVFVQFILGVFTLLYGVPVWLGLIHQVSAFLLLSAMTFTLHRLSK